jgi:drug/metabolite transporter (DMT)-like permease
MRLFGALLIIFGVLLLAWGGLTLFIPEGVVDMEAVSITVHENLVIPLPPILGLICLVLGVVMMASAPVYAPPGPPAPR